MNLDIDYLNEVKLPTRFPERRAAQFEPAATRTELRRLGREAEAPRAGEPSAQAVQLGHLSPGGLVAIFNSPAFGSATEDGHPRVFGGDVQQRGDNQALGEGDPPV